MRLPLNGARVRRAEEDCLPSSRALPGRRNPSRSLAKKG